MLIHSFASDKARKVVFHGTAFSLGVLLNFLWKQKRRGPSPWRTGIFVTALAIFLAGSAAAGGGKPATKLINVADTRGLDASLAGWIGDIYNSSLWTYGLTVVLIMAGMGAVLGFTFDKLVDLSGIKLGKLEHRE